ncbi:pyridoxamine 5'-phosphate oxidase family protein [Natrarchaeobaculum sulfurireducens]|uniref:Nitroimidazol reductase NimA n=1 Tax=Natrarchaeobaculum sulfurireducens TaxID=2044521 RepID=A0A346PD39_9EURY|nr:pyridoxamine 5'-phosphate oxidase family protein [Natrarchaeobaculum sulfurireducens]AXR77434.1 Nitroimidazol reductase NimA [Natrarchaeobaculum sulfurireducens]
MSIDELRAYGLTEMTDPEIANFLASQRVGVLALPEEGAPYLFPISYGFDGDDSLYFTYLSGSSSRKRQATDVAETASFLVFAVDTMYSWESVLLTGRLERGSESAWDDVEALLADVWRPDLFESASLSGDVELYEFRIEDRSGVKHQGLPPGLEPSET